MLVEFRISNYRSLGEEQVLSLEPATNQRDYPENIFQVEKFQVLNAAALYGANGSGKSNLFRGLHIMRQMVLISSRLSSAAKLPYDPFLLRDGLEQAPVRMELTFLLQNSRYRYGFTFDESAVLTEWLYKKTLSREVTLFEREGDTIDVSHGFKGSRGKISTAIEVTRNNALFLSVCDMVNLEDAQVIMDWFQKLTVINGNQTEELERDTVLLWDNEDYRDILRGYLSRLKLGIRDIEISRKNFGDEDFPEGTPEELKEELASTLMKVQTYMIKTLHQRYDRDGNPTASMNKWHLSERESSGTRKAFQLSGPVLQALIHGGTLVIDEIEANMHPIMTLNTIQLFLNPESNPHRAQLLFATHDTNLLSYSNLRRDQIYFAEKNRWESTEIYSLSDFVYSNSKNGEFVSEKERPDTNKEKRYIEGRYGAIPVLSGLTEFMQSITWEEAEK